MGTEAKPECKIWLGKEKMEEVNEFKYLRTMLCKHGSMEGEIRVKGSQVMGALERVMKGRSVSMAVKKGIRNGVILPTLSYASRDMDMECSTAITNKSSGNELHAGCL